ncbi:MAG: hypothetical protein GWN86_19075, partial [Desulfobacterales bacterium]|nr:hypothetical protein [Desulfobacterales bacterium]
FSGLLSYRELDPDGLDSFVKFSLAELQEEIDLDLFILDNEDNVVFATGQQTVLAEDDRLLVDIARRNADKKPYLYDAGSTEGKIKITAPIRREGNILGTVM